jgi:hypothetical protein
MSLRFPISSCHHVIIRKTEKYEVGAATNAIIFFYNFVSNSEMIENLFTRTPSRVN